MWRGAFFCERCRAKKKSEWVSKIRYTIILLRSCNQSIKVEMQIACESMCARRVNAAKLPFDQDFVYLHFWLVWRYIENNVYCAIICVNMQSYTIWALTKAMQFHNIHTPRLVCPSLPGKLKTTMGGKVA